MGHTSALLETVDGSVVSGEIGLVTLDAKVVSRVIVVVNEPLVKTSLVVTSFPSEIVAVEVITKVEESSVTVLITSETETPDWINVLMSNLKW